MYIKKIQFIEIKKFLKTPTFIKPAPISKAILYCTMLGSIECCHKV